MRGRTAVLSLVLVAMAGAAVSQQAPVTITTATSLPDGYLSLPYGPPPSFQGLQFSATTNPSQATVSWSIVRGNGTAPPGLTLTTTGFFSGTPTAIGTYTFVVGAVTQYGNAQQTFTVRILTPSLVITTNNTLPILGGSINQFYNFTFTATANPPLGVLWFADVLPPGLSLNQSTGALSGYPTQVGTYTIPITAQLSGTNLTTTTTFSLSIFGGQVSILTTTLPIAQVGQAYSFQLLANPQGVIWQLAGSTLPTGFNFDTTTGILSGGGTVAGIYKFAVQAGFPNYTIANATFTLYVTNGPLSILENSIPIAIQNVAYRTTVTPVGGLAPFQWSVAANSLGLTIDPNTATISGTPTLPPGTSYPLSVTVSDVAGEKYTQPYSVFVAAPLSVATTSLPNGLVGAPYVQTISAAGGQAPYAWVLPPTSPPLPPGLSFGSDGVIRGTPTVNGVFPFIVQVTDNGKRTASANLSITIGANVPLTIGPNSLPDGQPSVTYSIQLTAVGGTPPYIFTTTASALPLGLSLSSSGLLSGTPVGPPQAPLGTSTFTVTVHDSSSQASPLTGQKTYTLNITLPLSLSTTSLPNGTVGTPYPQTTLQASGGQPPYNYSVASGALPAGLNLIPLNGAETIGGTPSGPAGVSTFTILLQDAGGQTVQRQFSVTIGAAGSAPAISNGDSSGTVGTPFSLTLAATGGTAPYTFALTGGTPPGGLAFSAGPPATLSGTPTVSGSTALTFTVTDAQQLTGSKTINITIAAGTPLTISTGDSSGTVGKAFSVTLAATGGTAPYTFTLTGGTPPAGLTFANGTLSGTPTASGTTALTFTVTDSQKLTATKAINITINLPPPPAATLSTTSTSPAAQPTVNLSLGSAYPADIAGTLSLSFQSAAGGSPAEVQFLPSAANSVTFTIPAGQLAAPPFTVATGTVAGTITIAAKFTAGGVDVTPSPAPTQTIVIKPSVPVIQSVSLTNTSGVVTVTVIGYSTTREVVSGDFVFSVSTGNTVTNGGDVSVPFGSAFTTWYASSASNPFGGQFKLTIPFNVANGTAATVTSVRVTLTNTIGTSAAASPQ